MSSASERLAAVRARLASGREDNLRVVRLEAERPIQTPTVDEASSKVRRTPSAPVDRGDEADEEDADERLRSLKRRSKALGGSKREDAAQPQQQQQQQQEFENGELQYGGEGRVDKDALDDMVEELQQVQERRTKYRRRRKFDEDRANITFINEGNRVFNRALDKHFDKFESVRKIKDNLERGTA